MMKIKKMMFSDSISAHFNGIRLSVVSRARVSSFGCGMSDVSIRLSNFGTGVSISGIRMSNFSTRVSNYGIRLSVFPYVHDYSLPAGSVA
jgi:hypothetical protein